MSEANQQPVSADFAGYPDANSLARGYRESGKEAQRQKARADQLEQQLAQYQQAQANPRQDVPQRTTDPLEDYGLPAQALRNAWQSDLREEVQRIFQPIAQGMQGRNQMLNEYGQDYLKYEADVARYVESDPVMKQRYTNMFQADPVGAMDFAFSKYSNAMRAQHAPGQSEQVREEQAQAQIPASRSGDARNGQGAYGAQDELNRAWDHFQKTGDGSHYAKLRVRSVLKDTQFQE